MPKKSVNISIDADLLAEAKAYKINLSQALARSVTESVKDVRIKAWQRENAAAIEAENDFIRKHGVFSAGGKPW